MALFQMEQQRVLRHSSYGWEGQVEPVHGGVETWGKHRAVAGLGLQRQTAKSRPGDGEHQRR